MYNMVKNTCKANEMKPVEKKIYRVGMCIPEKGLTDFVVICDGFDFHEDSARFFNINEAGSLKCVAMFKCAVYVILTDEKLQEESLNPYHLPEDFGKID